ncbi:TetR-like C-terminal domain-containing protein [Nocardia sp. BMG111209]|uniref:TetR-like C-terminal domain-containing protein n=1 Tax=Nocardia sp. BMG111209 TaxID=1160137 RepID=UPI000366D57D|nr:TetR-like C-terminal domain-containing protein [Nocardia sp. BMG111209]
MAEGEKVRRPGGRSARVQAAVHAAVTELVAERGYGNFTIAEVAARAGVADTSVYRRWGDLETLSAEVVSSWLTTHASMPDTGSLEGDLQAYAAGVADDILGPQGLAVLRLLIALSSGGEPGLRARDAFVAGRRIQLQEMLDRAAARGEQVPPGLSVVDFILAPLYIRVLFGMPLPAADVRTQVARLLADAQGKGAPSSPG